MLSISIGLANLSRQILAAINQFLYRHLLPVVTGVTGIVDCGTVLFQTFSALGVYLACDKVDYLLGCLWPYLF